MKIIRNLIRDIEHSRRMHEDADFMAEAEAATRLQARWSASALLFTVAALFISFILWASFAEVEQITRGTGQVAPSSETQMVQSLEGGILAELLVQEGSAVRKGDVLARVSNVAFASDEQGIQAKAASLTLKRDRLKAEAEGRDFVPDAKLAEKFPAIAANEVALHESRLRDLKNALSLLDDKIAQSEASLREISAQIGGMSQTRSLLQKEVDMTSAMVAKKAAPEMNLIRAQRELADISGNINAASQRREAVNAELSVSKRERAQKESVFKSEALTDISDVEANLAPLAASLRTATDRVDRSELRAPADGIVKTIHQNTVGGVIEPAKVVMEIVPIHDKLKVTAKVSPNDIGFLKVGQQVKVKITAYDAQRYGALDGHLTRIGADTVTDSKGNVFFEIDATTDKNHLGTEADPKPITPGMVAQVDVITGKRTIMSYLMKPFLRARYEALTER